MRYAKQSNATAGGALRLLAVFVLTTTLAACSGGSSDSLPRDSQQPVPSLSAQQPGTSAGIPIPQDSRKPWESLDSRGLVIPATDSSWLNTAAGRAASAINEQSQFVAGAQLDSFDGSVGLDGLAAQFSSPANGMSLAYYRIPLLDVQPGALSVDVNLLTNTDTSRLSQCWIGVAEFGKRAWEWYGAPEAQTRFSLAQRVDEGADYTNELGNLQLVVVAADGARFDLVGIGVNTLETADSSAPPAPTGLSATPVASGLELQWNSVIAADLAGYRVYYSKTAFNSTTTLSVRKVPYLQGSTRHLLQGLSGNNFVRVTAVDIGGNESALSEQVNAAVLGGSPPALEVTTTLSSGTFGSSAMLQASGASSYDIDTDGDGIFEITGSASGTASIDTEQTGIIRPAVRGSNSGGDAVAHGAVSLIIAANLPPVAQLTASENVLRLWGDAPGNTSLDASASIDEDSASLQYAFDADGNGSFSAASANDGFSADYFERGTYLASVRVTDSAGLVGYASTLVEARIFSGFAMQYMSTQSSSASACSAAIVSGAPSMAMYNPMNGGQLFYSRARDNEGRIWREPFAIDLGMATGQYPDLAEIAGNPAVAYFDSDDNQLKYIRANSSGGSLQTSWSNPPVPVVEMASVQNNSISLIGVAGQPAIVYIDPGMSELLYVRATGGSGTGNFAGDWTMTPVVIDSMGLAGTFDIAVVDGNPAVSYFKAGDIYYKRSLSATGALQTDWAQVPFSINGSDDTVPDSAALAVVNGNPAVAYIDPSIPTLRYVRANDSTGATQANWPAPVSLPFLSGPLFTDLEVIDGRPVVLTWANFGGGSTQPLLNRSRDTEGAAWDKWIPVTENTNFSFNFQRPNLVAGPDGFGVATVSGSGIGLYFAADFE